MRRILAAAFAAGLMASGAVAGFTSVDFSNGPEGWVGPTGPGGATFIDVGDGNGAPSLRTQFNDFGITFRNDSNPAFIGDYTQDASVTFSVDVIARQVSFFGLPAPRVFIIELRDYDNAEPGYPWTSVYYELGVLNENDPGWHTWSVTIDDTGSSALPAGWGGYGAEDPNTFEPMLPPGRSFADVLASVDEIALTTMVPGFFFGFTDFDVSIDNITISRVPEPATLTLLAAAGLLALRRR
jgi:hypothetical protein